MRFETPQDLENEERIAGEVAKVCNVTMRKLPDRYAIDFAAFKNESLEFWAEIKRRNLSIGQKTFYDISLMKMMAGRELELATGKMFYLIVEFHEGIFSCRPMADGGLFRVVYGGRSDRPGVPNDMEPMAYFDCDAFVPLNLLGDGLR